jgi:hypothetical protein
MQIPKKGKEVGKRPWDVALSDYFQCKGLLAKRSTG